MQIFWPEYHLKKSAMVLDDKRLNKQIIEMCQIFSTAIWIENCDIAETLCSKSMIYLPTHEHHPVIRNFKYYYFMALDYLEQLLLEYNYRFNKQHKCDLMFDIFLEYQHLFLNYKRERFNNYTTNHKHIKNVNEAYKKCLIEKWKESKPVWTNRETPKWFTSKS